MVDSSRAGNAVVVVAEMISGSFAKPPSLLPNTENGGYSREKWTAWKNEEMRLVRRHCGARFENAQIPGGVSHGMFQ